MVTTQAVALLGALSAAGCGSAPPAPAPAPPKVEVRHPEVRELVDYDRFNGWMDAAETVDVRSRVRGHIQKVDFVDGQIVEKDQLLFELDPRPFHADIDAAKDQLKIFEAQSQRADAEEKRIQKMAKDNVASVQELEKAVADAKSFRAQIEAAKQDITRKELDLEYSRITAPIAGRVGRTMLTEGNLVNAGGSDPILTTIVSISPMYVYFNVDERSLQRYRKARTTTEPTAPGTSLRNEAIPFWFGLETDEGFPHQGVLNFADVRVDRNTGTIQVRGEVPNGDRLFIAGSRVRVQVPVSSPHQVTLVSDTALLADQDRRYVLVMDQKNVVHRRDVTPGKLLDDGMRIVEPRGGSQGQGLSPQDWVLVSGLQTARLEYPVEPVQATTGPAEQGQAVTAADEQRPAHR
jgi:RND family efflux transporter MFP subunit